MASQQNDRCPPSGQDMQEAIMLDCANTVHTQDLARLSDPDRSLFVGLESGTLEQYQGQRQPTEQENTQEDMPAREIADFDQSLFGGLESGTPEQHEGQGQSTEQEDGEEDEEEGGEEEEEDEEEEEEYNSELNIQAYYNNRGKDEGDGCEGSEEGGPVVEQHQWNVSHSGGERSISVTDFIKRTKSQSFNGEHATRMLQTHYTMDYGASTAGCRPAAPNDNFHPIFHLDMIAVVGRPLKAITRCSKRMFFSNITVSFQNWRAPYSRKHLHGIPFDLGNRTFRIATADTREKWYIVMHPVIISEPELPTSRPRRTDDFTPSSAMQPHHARELLSYIHRVFRTGSLQGEGIEPSWTLSGSRSQNMTMDKWTLFQEIFMEEWRSFAEDHSYDPFWRINNPAFHAYDYGANIEITNSPELKSLPCEIRLRPVDDTDDEGEAELDSEINMSPQQTPNRLRRLQASEDDDVTGMPAVLDSPASASIGPEPATNSASQYEQFYTDKLGDLKKQLQEKYALENIGTVSYALAVDINCTEPRSLRTAKPSALCLLADRNKVDEEYNSQRDYTFYPLGFHPKLGNFSSPQPPEFIRDYTALMRDNMSYQNDDADPLSFGYFQGYSNIKRSIRHDAGSLLATQGIATAALTLPVREANATSYVKSKRQRLLAIMAGEQTPHDPCLSQPFAREGQQIDAAIEAEEYAFRMEQVVSVNITHLTDRERSFSIVLRPIFQLIRIFLQEPERYTKFLTAMPPEVFPGVLRSFASVFSLALDEIHRGFQAWGGGALGVARSEAVAAIDRLGSYCFTGMPKSLMASVLRALGTIDSIRTGGWPYINPGILDFREGRGVLVRSKWPRTAQGRPALMHPTALGFHYGPEVAARRCCNVWFEELGGICIDGPGAALRFLKDLFRTQWVPQMVAFTRFQFYRSPRYREGNPVDVADQRRLIEDWSRSNSQFTWQNYENIAWLMLPECAGATTLVARRDFCQELYQSCAEQPAAGQKRYAPCHATWYSHLSVAINHTLKETVSKEQWIGALATTLTVLGIEGMPGACRAKLSTRAAIRLVGNSPPAGYLMAKEGSLKRIAIEAEEKLSRPAKKPAIHFGYDIPFTTIPTLVQEGFKKAEARKDSKVQAHYAVANACLEKFLGDPRCDVLLMLVLTLASSSVTPVLLSGKTEFSSTGKRKDPAIFAAHMVLRMLWYLDPESFPQGSVDENGVLRVSAMIKKIEHTGVANRTLLFLGWVALVGKSARENPRNSEIRIRDFETLRAFRKDLISVKKDAERFFRVIFKSNDRVWLDRCSSIVV